MVFGFLCSTYFVQRKDTKLSLDYIESYASKEEGSRKLDLFCKNFVMSSNSLLIFCLNSLFEKDCCVVYC